MSMWRVTYESSPGALTVWEKPLAELLVPNGPDDTLLSWLMREADERGAEFRVERVVRKVPCIMCHMTGTVDGITKCEACSGAGFVRVLD